MHQDPMRTHRRKEGVAWGVALLGVIVGVFTMFVNPMAGFIILLLALIIACVICRL